MRAQVESLSPGNSHLSRGMLPKCYAITEEGDRKATGYVSSAHDWVGVESWFPKNSFVRAIHRKPIECMVTFIK